LVAASGIIFFANGFGELYAIDPFNGDIIWQKSVGVPIRSSPIADNKLVYVLGVDNIIHAFDILTSERIWQYEWFSDAAGFIQTSDMALYKNFLIVPYRSGEVFVFDAYSGRRIWADTVNRKNITSSLSQIKDIIANPILHNEILISIGFQGRLIANNINNGFRLWELPISSDLTPVATDDYLFIISQENVLFAIDISKGDILWTKDLNSKYKLDSDDKLISKLLLNNVIHVFTSFGDIIKFDARDGAFIETLNNQIENLSIPPIVVNKKLYVVSNNGILISYE
jgi:outer membrane protein assembly factor BamB